MSNVESEIPPHLLLFNAAARGPVTGTGPLEDALGGTNKEQLGVRRNELNIEHVNRHCQYRRLPAIRRLPSSTL
jgi:hypothetical protein